MRCTRAYQCHVKSENHRRTRTIATIEQEKYFLFLSTFLCFVADAHLYIFSDSLPISNAHIAGVKQWIVFGDCVDDPSSFALNIRQNHWSKTSRIAETHLCIFFIVHMRILPNILDKSIRFWFQYYIGKGKQKFNFIQ